MYKVIAGVPDFRIYPFPYSKNEDSQVNILLDNYKRCDYLKLYELRLSFLFNKNRSESELKRVQKIHEESLRNLRDYHNSMFSTNMKIFLYIIRKMVANEKKVALELGCGLGKQIQDMLSMYKSVIAIDNSFVELILAKKLLEQQQLESKVQLICACSEALPFGTGSFDAVNMKSVLEHVNDQVGSMQEVYRVLSGGGVLLMQVPNRFTLGREPHVKVYGVGFVPRKWMRKYVDLMTNKQLTFDGIKSLSYFELKALLKTTFGIHWTDRARLIDESRAGVTIIGKMYRRFDFVKRIVENLFVKMFCSTHYVAAYKKNDPFFTKIAE